MASDTNSEHGAERFLSALIELDTPMQRQRRKGKITVPSMLRGAPVTKVYEDHVIESDHVDDRPQLKEIFPKTFGQRQIRLESDPGFEGELKPLKVGLILSGGQAPGGHNVIAGVFHRLQQRGGKCELLGFLGGPDGLIKNQFVVIDQAMVNKYRNMGGFDMIGSGRTKIETPAQFEAVRANVTELDLDGLIVIGGDDSNTNAGVLAEDFLQKGIKTVIIGVPKTIDGDLKNQYIETSFGFDSATKLYSELIANICTDALSARKYYHFVRLMGRSASHITLECALQTRPNVAIISEEIANLGTTLAKVVETLAKVVVARAARKKNFGVVLIPEGLVEFLPDVGDLITELNRLCAHDTDPIHADMSSGDIAARLSEACGATFLSLPETIQKQLLLDRDSHGNVQVSMIETEKLLSRMVKTRLQEMAKEGTYKGSFKSLNHFLGYEGRCVMPSVFDCNYCFALGMCAVELVHHKKTGYMARLYHLTKEVNDWLPGGVPLTGIMGIEERDGKQKAVIHKSLVDLHHQPFMMFAKARNNWSIGDFYRNPGPIQFEGEGSDLTTLTLLLDRPTMFRSKSVARISRGMGMAPDDFM